MVTQNFHNYAAPSPGMGHAPPPPRQAGGGKGYPYTKVLLWTFGVMCVVLAVILKSHAEPPVQAPEHRADQVAEPAPAQLVPAPSPSPVLPQSTENKVSGNVTIGNANGMTIINQNGTVIMPAQQPAPAVKKAPAKKPVLRAAPPKNLTIQFDRPDSIYHQGDTQDITLQVPSAGYLYVASVWAAGNGTYSLFHPAWSAGLVQEGSKGGTGLRTFRLDQQRYGKARQSGELGAPFLFKAGDVLILPDAELSFPDLPDTSVDVTFEHVLVILSEELLPSIPSFYGKGPKDEGNIEQALTDLKLLRQNQILRARGGLPPDIIEMQSRPKLTHAAAYYEMRRAPRK